MRPLLHPSVPTPLTDDIDEVATDRDRALLADLGAGAVVEVMADGDRLTGAVARQLLVAGTTDPQVLAHRRAAVADTVAHPELVRELYTLATRALIAEREVYSGLVTKPTSILQRAVDVLTVTLGLVRRMRDVAARHHADLDSVALAGVCEELRTRFAEPALAPLDDQLERLTLAEGIALGARLGVGGRGMDHRLLAPPRPGGVLRRLLPTGRSATTIRLDDHDDAGAQALGELRERAVEQVAALLDQASRALLDELGQLRRELAFLVGAANLAAALARLGQPVCVPEALPATPPVLRAEALVDAGLALRTGTPPVANDLDARDVGLVVVTGANQGGKSTFLRSVGLAQLMSQAGLFVTARSFASSLAPRVHSHFERAEDPTMTSGRLDAELTEMSTIVDQVRPGDLLLLNESFGSTNEREGSLIANDIVTALDDAGVRVVYVTHLYELAHTLHEERRDRAAFLRAERGEDGRRTYRLRPGIPLETSFGDDLYRQVFGDVDEEVEG